MNKEKSYSELILYLKEKMTITSIQVQEVSLEHVHKCWFVIMKCENGLTIDRVLVLYVEALPLFWCGPVCVGFFCSQTQ